MYLPSSHKWHIFLSHSSADADVAEALYDLLRPHCEVFLDTQCIRYGDDWDKVLAQAQSSSWLTVVIASRHTEQAYYQRDEIAYAIEMSRRDGEEHRVVPIFFGRSPRTLPDVPPGLRLKHGLTVSGKSGLPKAVERLVRQMNEMAEERRAAEAPANRKAKRNARKPSPRASSPAVMWERELHVLGDLLERNPAVNVWGPCGVGKSELASTFVAGHIRKDGAAHAAWVDCSHVREYDDLSAHVTAALGESGTPGPPGRLSRMAGDAPLLIVFDHADPTSMTSLMNWLADVPPQVRAVVLSDEPERGLPGLEMRSLSEEAACGLLEGLTGSAGHADLLSRVCKRSDRSPLSILILAGCGRDEAAAPLEEVMSRRGRQVVTTDDLAGIALSLLSESARESLARVSMLPAGLSLNRASEYLGHRDWETVVDECTAANLARVSRGRMLVHQKVAGLTLGEVRDLTRLQHDLVKHCAKFALEDIDLNDGRRRAELDAEWPNLAAGLAAAEFLHDWTSVRVICAAAVPYLEHRGMWSTLDRHVNPKLALAKSAPETRDAVLVVAKGEFDLHTSSQLRAALSHALQYCGTGSVLIVDLNRVVYMDSIALGVLLSALKRAGEMDAGVTLICTNPRPLRILDVTGYRTLFEVRGPEPTDPSPLLIVDAALA